MGCLGRPYVRHCPLRLHVRKTLSYEDLTGSLTIAIPIYGQTKFCIGLLCEEYLDCRIILANAAKHESRLFMCTQAYPEKLFC